MSELFRTKFEVKGIVQGVGFRPFASRLAEELELTGWVRNTEYGAELELQGTKTAVQKFGAALVERKPLLAVIHNVRKYDVDPIEGEGEFKILTSSKSAENDALISPDVAICPDCRRELFTPGDRRFRFPFINCTNCGPRFSIVKDIPYDRKNTSMSVFPMCPDCGREYGDIRDRRYHAQPDCCPVCGPELTLVGSGGEVISGDPITEAKRLIKEGKILAIKGLGGFHLACLSDKPELVAELRRRKHRDEKPFAIMARDTEAAEEICFVSEKERELLESYRAPIVLLRKRPDAPGLVSDNLDIGVMLPYTPLHCLIMEDFKYLIMTSANMSDCPVITDNGEALRELCEVADAFLIHNRAIETRCDDSLVRVALGRVYPLRRSRGYAPEPVVVNRSVSGILACGAEQKASFAVGKGRDVFISQHIGDLKNAETLSHYEEQTEKFLRLFGVTPRKIVCDKHPDYLSTGFAESFSEKHNIPLCRVQHHHAHMVSCMADNNLTERCIGLIWDGTGCGDDGTIWGGECLIGDAKVYERVGTIRKMALPGGDLCTKELDRVAISLMCDAGLPIKVRDGRESLILKQLERRLNSPESSGMGRLFDGIYAMITGKNTASYEGQGAILLEAMASDTKREYDCCLYSDGGILTLDTRQLVSDIYSDIKNKVSEGEISGAFHNTLITLALKQCQWARERSEAENVVLSGGVFQNMRLLNGAVKRLKENGFNAYTHSRVSVNDEGISLGQMLIAAEEGD